MNSQKYTVYQPTVESLLSWIKAGEIAIPEIQRPFVWNSVKVRDLMDSLYQGYPIGYLIIWKNPNVQLKDGSISEGKKILIDGQQRITAMMTAILGQTVFDKHYNRKRIKIAFNPIEEKFETYTAAIGRDKRWLNDIFEALSGNIFQVVNDYLKYNPDADPPQIQQAFQQLHDIKQRQIGIIELSGDLDIEKVTEIFIRINSKGVELNQADFVMSKIASNEKFNGVILRKLIDYFSHLIQAPEFYHDLEKNDKDFITTPYFRKISWVRKENIQLYKPDYKDIIRVSFTHQFNRGRLKDLVSLLAGRNFETRRYEEKIVEETFKKIFKGVENFVNETHFKRFLMILSSAGFIDEQLLRSKVTVDFAYILYLKLREQNYSPGAIERYVKKWLVLSILTGRYISSPESMFDHDIRQISKGDFGEYLHSVEESELSESFWKFGIIDQLKGSNKQNPAFNVFLSAQCYFNDKGFLSKDITVRNLIEQRGDIHHIFPRDLLAKRGMSRNEYNQVANYVYTQTEINIQIKNKPIEVYMQELKEQCNGGLVKYGNIVDENMLIENFKQNAIPVEVFNMTMDDYEEFLEMRRRLMADKIRRFYESL